MESIDPQAAPDQQNMDQDSFQEDIKDEEATNLLFQKGPSSITDNASTRLALSSQKSKDQQSHQASISYLLGLTIVVGISSMQFGLALASTGPIVPALRYQLNWGNEREVFDFNVTILSTSALVGIALGNIFGGDFVKNGRRKTIIIFNILGAIATCFTLVLDFNSMCFGRCLFGFASGILSCATPKVLDETIPANLMDKGFGTSTNIIINFAFFAVLIMAMGMPETQAELIETKYWMLIYGLQLPFQILAILFHTFVFSEEPIEFCIRNNNKEGALKGLKKVYPRLSQQALTQMYQNKFDLYEAQKANQTGLEDNAWNVFTQPETMGAAWMCWVIAVFNNMSGIGIINIFSTAIFENIKLKGAQSALTVKQENYLIGVSGLVGAVLSFWSCTFFSRRSIFIGGHAFMSFLLFMVAYFIDTKYSDGVLVSLCIFIIVYQATQGTAFWIYVAEVVQSDSVIGICLFTQMLQMNCQSVSTLYVLNSKIGVNGLFLAIAGVHFIAMSIFWFFLKETHGLSANEKKQLYSPKVSEVLDKTKNKSI